MTISREARATLTPDGDLVVARGDEGLALWPYTQAWWRCRRSTDPRHVDPVNGIVLRTAPDRVLQDLTAEGWHRPSDGARHCTWIADRRCRMVDHRALGERDERIHVRVFPFGDHTILAAHHEVMDDSGHHVVVSWDGARAALGESLTHAGYVGIAPSARVAVPDLRGVSGDGRVWRWVGSPAE